MAVRKLEGEQLTMLDGAAGGGAGAADHRDRRAGDRAVGHQDGVTIRSLQRGVPDAPTLSAMTLKEFKDY